MMKQFIIIVALLALVASCTPASDQSESQTSRPVDYSNARETIETNSPTGNDLANEPANDPGESRPMANETPSAAQKQAILSAIATQQNLSPDQLELTAAEAKDWPDACLGLAGPDEMCAQMLIPGWAVTVTDGSQTWQYRTDLDGEQARLDAK